MDGITFTTLAKGLRKFFTSFPYSESVVQLEQKETKILKRWMGPLAGLMIASAVAVPVFAQDPATSGQQPPDGNGRGGRGFGGVMICTTTTATDTVATALGMSAADLRLALVSGQTVSEIATSKNIDIATIQTALETQRKADLDAALADELITQEQYDSIIARLDAVPADSTNSNRVLNIRVSAHNEANIEQAAADALGMSCADLVKAQQAGQSIAEIAEANNVEVQSVIDAVTKAVEDAAAQDISEGLITQAQADGRTANISTQVGQWVYNTRPEGGRGDGPGGFDGQNGPGGRPGQQGQNGNQPSNNPGGRPGQGQPPGQPPTAPDSAAPAEATSTPNA